MGSAWKLFRQSKALSLGVGFGVTRERCRIEAKFGQTMEKAISHKMGLHSKASTPKMSSTNALAERHFDFG